MHEVGGGKLLSSADILPSDPMLSLKARYIWFRLQPVLELGVLAVQPEGTLDLLEALLANIIYLDVVEEVAVQLEAFPDGGGHLTIGSELLFAKSVVLK